MRLVSLSLVAVASLAFASVMFAPGAHAGLGLKTPSIAADQGRLKPRAMAARTLGTSDLHEMTLGDGGTVREFTSADGTVFAVSWRGPRRPDLRQLFGDAYFRRFQSDNAQTGRIRMRRALASTHSDFLVRTGGVSGAQWGYALLPQAMPPGFDTRTLAATDVQP